MKYVSVYHFPDRVWVIMGLGVGHCLEVCRTLLPIFLLIRFLQDYLQSSLQEELTVRALIAALFQSIFFLYLLLFYKDLVQALDHFIYELMELLGDSNSWRAYLSKTSDQLAKLKQDNPHTWWIQAWLPTRWSILRKIFSWTGLLGLRTLMMHIRGYLLLFSTQVGPLAIVVSILPGKLGGTLHIWFKAHLSVLTWGITMAILDRTLVSIDLASWSILGSLHDLLTTIAISLMYLFVGPLTSVYLGNTFGNGFLSAGLGASQRLYGFARKVIIRI